MNVNVAVCYNVCSVGGGGVISDDRSGHRTGHWTLSPVRVSAQNAAVYRKPAQTLPQCAPANEILFRRRGMSGQRSLWQWDKQRYVHLNVD